MMDRITEVIKIEDDESDYIMLSDSASLHQKAVFRYFGQKEVPKQVLRCSL